VVPVVMPHRLRAKLVRDKRLVLARLPNVLE
jgi:hypothetical protein